MRKASVGLGVWMLTLFAAPLSFAESPTGADSGLAGELREIISLIDVVQGSYTCPGANGPQHPTQPTQCAGTCPNGEECAPKIGTAGRRPQVPGSSCECLPKADTACDYQMNGRSYYWAGYCSMGSCPKGQSCKSDTVGGQAACKCVQNPPPAGGH